MELIASTPFYSYHIDKAKNRMYVAYKGAWLKPSQVPDFVKHHVEAISQLTRGFTVLADVRQMESVFITDVIEECQKQAIAAGVSKARQGLHQTDIHGNTGRYYERKDRNEIESILRLR